MSDKSKLPGYELFEQAMKNYEQALQAGLRLQQESARWWMDIMTQAGSSREWQGKAQDLAAESVNLVQRRLEENLQLLERGSRTGLELLKKAVEATRAETVSAGQTRMQELWEASLEAVRSNASAVQQANAKWMESWAELIPKAGPTPASKAAA